MTRGRILVIEDDVTILRLFSDLLPAHGLEAITAECAEEAYEKLAHDSFDLVITDKNMPGDSGLDVLAHVRKERPNLDVIIVTAYADVNSVLHAMREGAYDYLIKPFESLHDVMQKIERALEKRRMIEANLRLMVDLKAANERIERINEGLERQVAERTSQLATANQSLEEANRRLEALSLTDDVTNLYNQRFLYQRFEEEFRRALRYRTPLGVIMLDVDNFKQVNDEHDHLFGSRILKRLGEVLQACVRNVDICVRYGGDEFVIILPLTHTTEAQTVAERVRSTVDGKDFGDDGDPYAITVSVGVAALDTTAVDSPKALLQAADKALYIAKRGGRNRVVVFGQLEDVAEAG